MKIITTLKRFLVETIRSIGNVITARQHQAPPHCGNINHLLLHLCDFDYDLHAWVLRWIAYPLKNPGAKMSTALIFNGPEGTGTSLFFDSVITGLYQHAARRIDTEQLHSNSNAWAMDARFILVDPARPLAHQHSARLKELVSGAQIIVNRKFEPRITQPNRMNFVFVSSGKDFLPLNCADRRFAIVEAPPARDQRFYDAVEAEIENGGIDVFVHYLMHELDMKDFNEHTPIPSTLKRHADLEAA